MDRAGVPAWLARAEHDAALDRPARWRERAELLDRLDAWRTLDASAGDPALRCRVDALEARLLDIDRILHEAIRTAVRCGTGREALLELVRPGSLQAGTPSSDRYDALDTFVGGVLGLGSSAAALQPLQPGMVFYQPTPARHIFDSMDRLQLGSGDVLVDLGAGLGHVPLLAAICSHARCIGIEWQAAYVAAARACAADLGLVRASFVQGDICEADLGEGTVFYLYTPVSGASLRRVLDHLRTEASRREIRLCTLGPCTAIVAGESWLSTDGPCDRHQPVVFRSR